MNADVYTKLEKKSKEITKLFFEDLWSIKLLCMRFNVSKQDMGEFLTKIIEDKNPKHKRKLGADMEKPLLYQAPTIDEMAGDLASIEKDLYQENNYLT